MTNSSVGGGNDAVPTEAEDYDRLPYPSMPFADTQPARLAAIATLFGIIPPEIGCARVLELGCAAGGNIIPLAARFPQASFTGFDLSRRHVDDGGRRIAALALANVELLQADLTTLDLTGQQFDYVICNGVFSWVPRRTQDAIFQLCSQVLAPNGVVTISYNVLPGWHLRMVIRDICLHYAGTGGTPQRRVARARAALEQIAAASDEAGPYALLLRIEAKRLKTVPASYILGEFLAPDNTPSFVGAFIDRARDHGFDYLCEVDFCAAVPQALQPSIRSRLTSFATGRSASEQHIDFLTGRLFRRSVLVRRQPGGSAHRALQPERLEALHISSPVRLDVDQSTDRSAVFLDDRARPITVKQPAVRHAITRLAQAFPATLALSELVTSPGRDPGGDAENGTRIRQAVVAMILAGRATISVVPLKVGLATDDRPKAWFVAQIEAASGQPWMTSLCHAAVPVHPVLTALLPHLDGTHDWAALRARLATALRSRAVVVPELPADLQQPSQERLDAIAEHYVRWALDHLARHAFLETSTGH